MRTCLRNGALIAALTVALGVPSLAAADSGGTAPQAPPSGSGGGTAATPVATPLGDRKPPKRKKRRRRAAPRPVLASFQASASRFYDLGRPVRVSFRIDGRATVRVKLQVLRAGKPIRTIDLGDRATGRTHSAALTGREGGRLPEGALQLRLTARDARGRGLRPSSRPSTTDALAFYWHRFPVAGAFDYGGQGSRFGADRGDHVHEGQDLTAAEGTPVVAPRAGVVQTVDYEAGGGGHYVVLAAEGEDRSYVFMHLRAGSVRVSRGDRVTTGQRLGDVGSTGSSSGPHLHFEIWAGAWRAGGRPFDPLAELRRWDRWS
jgi:murein DD-endopeptidase MepM/ murein hydrolase activator NlpD